ncbi:Os03g0441050 [Oryza sativa Japonica Group]|uniref:Os03g0441050 protein n=1 Tax=Oryza sativa subsp. japonica TaxID=39947 RepID=A0A0N7KHI0_ORYSJ|nr:Os03g0441050 [Oryza sativa Japonica Group]
MADDVGSLVIVKSCKNDLSTNQTHRLVLDSSSINHSTQYNAPKSTTKIEHCNSKCNGYTATISQMILLVISHIAGTAKRISTSEVPSQVLRSHPSP